MKNWFNFTLSLFLSFFLLNNLNAQQMKWYKHYYLGLKAMEQGNYVEAAKHFEASLRVKDRDRKKMRAYGTVFIEYFPHRELGIALYHLGRKELARKQLLISINQQPSVRAKRYLKMLTGGEELSPPVQEEEKPSESESPPTSASTRQTENKNMVGERLSIAVLPFSSQGIGSELKDVDFLDKLITGFVNSKRFKVIERAQLEKILEEQKLGLSGIVDPTTAAEIGKGIGVDAVVLGSVTRAGNSLSIDARLIDTENATIISAQDAYSNKISIYQIADMVNQLAEKFKNDLPIVQGLVINVQGEKVTLDMGANKGLKKGMKCLIYREGDPIVHPVTKEVIGRIINQVCEVRITDIYPAYSLGEVTKQLSGLPQKLDKVITK